MNTPTTRHCPIDYFNSINVTELIDQSGTVRKQMIEAVLVSQAPPTQGLYDIWRYGTLRGGTNPVYLPKYKKHLAIFHTAKYVASGMHTYFMGAYTFTAEPPFRILEISSYPIMEDFLYTGPWNGLKNRHIDYVPFPMSLFFPPKAHTVTEGRHGGSRNGRDEHHQATGREDFVGSGGGSVEHEGDELLLSFGHQDMYSDIAWLQISRLLDSLVEVR